MTEKKLIQIKVQILSKENKIINGEVYIDDGIAISTFDDKLFAFNLYKQNSKVKVDGRVSIWDEQHKAYIERYEGMSKEEIRDLLTKELKKNKIKIN